MGFRTHMHTQTRKSLQDLAAILELLAQCQTRVERIPKRFPNLYICVPMQVTEGLRGVRCGVEELANQLVQYQHLPLSCADLSLFRNSPKK